MRFFIMLLLALCLLPGRARAANVPLSDFGNPSAWKANADGGHAPEVGPDPARREHGPAMRVRYRDQPPQWGNLVAPCSVPPEAVALRLWVYKSSAQPAAAMHVWLFEADNDGWVQQLRFEGGSLGDAAVGWHEVRLPIAGFNFDGRGQKTRQMLQVNRVLIGCNFADFEVSLSAMEWETGAPRQGLPLPRTEDLTIADGRFGRIGILDMIAGGHNRDSERKEPITTAHTPAQLAAAAEKAGFGVTILQPGDLLAPEVLTPQRLDAVVLPWGPYFPLEARAAFLAYLKAGGSFLATDGYAFDRLVTLTAQGWSAVGPERTIIARALLETRAADALDALLPFVGTKLVRDALDAADAAFP
ncbi:MAG: hypothetical protein WCP21_11660, partial [Armatimonadota bacterium]